MSKKILIIEDDSHLAEIYGKKLTSEGFEVMTARNGPAGLRMAKKTPPDLVLLDLLLPSKSGLEILKLLKADEHLGTTPVIVTSNVSDKAMVLACLGSGAADFIIKAQINLSELVVRVKKALSK